MKRNARSAWYRRWRAKRVRFKPHTMLLEPLEDRRVMAVVDWPGGDIPDGTIWRAGDLQRLMGDVRVPVGATLTVEPGAVVKFNHFSVDMTVAGTLNAVGAVGNEIVFTEIRDDVGGDTNGDGANSAPGRGNWGRLEVVAGGAATIEHAQIRYGGFDSLGQVTVDQGSLTLRNSTISESVVDGVRIQSADPILTGNRYENNTDAALSMDLASNPAISGVTLFNNRINGLQVDGGTLAEDGLWNDADIVYVTLDDITVPAGRTLTVSAGQVVKFGHFSFDLFVHGTFDAQGSSAAPIVFTELRDDETGGGGDTNNDGANSAPGHGNWGRVELTGPANMLRNVEFRYGGFDSLGQLVVSGGELNYTDGKVLKSVTAGLRIETSNPTIANVEFQNSFRAAISMDLASNPTITGNNGPVVATGNAVNGLLLDGGTIASDAFWDDPEIVYVTDGDITVAAGSKLTVGAEQVVKFRHFSYDLFVNGTLDAQSTSAAPIVFTEFRDDAGGDTNNDATNSAPGNGNWGRVELTGPANMLRNVEFRYGGFDSLGQLVVSGGELNYTDGKVLKSVTAGLRIETSNPTIANVEFQNSFRAAISMDLASNPTITGNNGPVVATGNAVNGLLLDGGTIASDAFWDNPNIVYVTNGDITVAKDRKLTVGAGQVVKFGHFSYDLFVPGTLDARGTAAAPIVFTEFRDDTGGDTNNDAANSGPGRGNWGRIELAGPANVLHETQVRFGGFNSAAQLVVSRGGLSFVGGAVEESGVTGLRIVGSGATIDGVRLRNNSGAAISMDLDSNPAISGATVENNGTNGALLDAGFVYCRAVWDNPTIPYVLSGDVMVPPGATLEIAPGQIVKASSGQEIVVDGRLMARGTPAQPIVLTSLRDDTAGGDTNNNGTSSGPNNGDWTGVRLTSTSDDNELAFTEVRFAGDNGVGAVVLDDGSLAVANSTIRNSSSRGIVARNNALLQVTIALLFGNTDTALQVESSSTATIINATIDGNRRGIAAADAGVTLTNSLVTNHSRTGVLVSGTGAVIGSFNIVFNPTATNGNYEGLPDQTGSNGNLSANPLYVDTAARNYVLASGSPAIDSATSSGAPLSDLSGRGRFDDPDVANSGTGAVAFVDRGAFERQPNAGGESAVSSSAASLSAADGEGTGMSIYDTTADSRSSWINAFNLFDVSDDGFTSPIDVLQIFNDLNATGSRLLPAVRPSNQPYLDVNGDLFVSPLDALIVINALIAGLSPHVLTFVEQATFLGESTRTLTLGGTGTRRVRLEVKTALNGTATDSEVPDLLLLYLVNPDDRADTLLDNGAAGTPFFAWDGATADYPPGTVRFDGRFLDLDLIDFGGLNQGRLVAQLLNSDSDTGGRAFVRIVSNQMDVAGTPTPHLDQRTAVRSPGGALNTAALAAAANLTPIIDNVRFNSENGHYAADLRVRNDGPAIGRQVAVTFDALPTGVTLADPSGTLADATPYISLRDAIPAGGLRTGSTSQPVVIEIDNPNHVRFPLTPEFRSGGPNLPPALSVVPVLNVTPGGRLEQPLSSVDPDGDPVTFALLADGDLPSGMLTADGTLVFTPAPDQLGTYNFMVQASDGTTTAMRPVTLNVNPDPLATTRVSGIIQDVDQRPLAGMQIEIGGIQGLTQSDGSFLLDLGVGPVVGDTLKVRGELFSGPLVYPFIAEKLAFILEHAVFQGANNVISRPIFLPPLDVAGGTQIDPMQNTTVSQEFAPGETAEVMVAAGTLMDQQGTPFTGTLSITEVPASLTPAALPASLVASTVVTIQPGEMVFAAPAPLTLPNTDGWAAGTLMDLWSINPVTGEFDKVGTGRVSPDGSQIETISGGIRNSSWHFYSDDEPEPDDPEENPSNENTICTECPQARVVVASEVELHSGAVLEMHSTVPYQSQGTPRNVTLTYDSLRADPRPIVHVGYNDVDPGIYSVPDALRLIVKMTVRRGNFVQALPGYSGSVPGLSGGEHFWTLPSGRGSLDAALQLDLRMQPSGRYEYDIMTGVRGFAGARGYIGASTEQRGSLLSVNTIDSPFGAGWGIAGLQELVENSDGSVLIIDGDGGEVLFEAPATPGGAYGTPPGDYSTLQKQLDGTFRRTMKDQSVDVFNAQDLIAEMRDRNGNTTRYEYDGDGVLSKIIDPVGLETIFTRTGDRITAITDPAGRVTQLAYDAAGNLISITDPDDTSRTFGYDGEHHLTSEIDQRGFREESIYNFAGRLASVTRKDGSVLHVEPLQVRGLYPADATIDPTNAPQAVRRAKAESGFADARGNVTRTVLDAAGQAVSQFDSVGLLPAVQRNSENQGTSARDARGHTSGFTYDDRGNVIRSVDEVSAAGVLALYTFEGDAHDVTGNGHDGTVNGASIDTGFDGSGFHFDGLNDFIDLPVNINASVHPRLTMGAWVKADDPTPVRQVLSQTDGCFDRSFGIDFRGGDAGWSAFTGSGEVLGAQPVTVGQWTFIAAVYDQDAGRATFYVDDQALTELGTLEDGFDFVRLGSSPIFGEFLAGTVDNVFFIADALSATQVEAIRVGGAGAVLGSSLGGRLVEYDATFNVPTKEVDELGRQSLFNISSTNGNVESVTEVVGEPGGGDDLVTGMTYDAQGLLATLTDPQGDVTRFERDLQGRTTAITYAAGTPDAAVDRFEYDDAGNVTAMIDANGNRTVMEYDALSRMTRITEADPDGAGPLAAPVTNMTYDAVGNLTAVTDALGRQTQYTFDALNRVTQIVDADGQTERKSYDADGHVVSMTDRLGRETRFRYDARGRMVESVDPLGGRWQWRYDTDDHVIASTDANGRTTNFSYDARGRMTRSVDALGGVVTYRYDLADQLVSVTDENGHTTQYQYDDLGRRVSQRDPLGGVQTYDYDRNGNLVALTDELNRTTRYAYDQRDRLISRTNPLNGAMTFRFDAVGNLLQVTDELNRSTQFTYDALNRLLRGTDALGGTMTNQYDAVDNVVRVTDELDRAYQYSYDELNRPVSTTDPLGHVSTATYDAVGNVLSTADALGHGVTFVYDVLDRVTRQTDARDGVTSFTYDAVGNILSLTDAVNNTTRLQYDALNRTTAEIDALGKARAFVYDPVGNLTSVTDRNDRVRQFTYDELDRRTAEQWLDSAGTPVRTFDYTFDAASQMTTAADPVSSYAWTYDLDGRVTAMSNAGTAGVPAVVFTYAYDAVDNLLTRGDTINGVARGTNSYTYDVLNRMTRVTQAGTGVADKRVDMAYDAASQMTGVTRFADLAGTQLVAGSDYTYDAAGRLTALAHTKGATPLAAYTWTFDDANRITAFNSPDGSTTYTYDNTDQLVGANHSVQDDEAYDYDLNGNRTNAGYQTAATNRLQSDGRFNYQYDGEGNRTRRTNIANGEITDYEWDHRNRLTRVATKANDQGQLTKNVLYTYDVLDRRIAKSVDADGAGPTATAIERFVYDGDHIALTFNGAGNETHRYLHGPAIDQVLADESATDTVLWALTDNLGTVRDLVDSTGAIQNHLSYDSFGQITAESNAAVDHLFAFAGREFDAESGLYFNRARYYDAAVGRFLSVDPLPGRLGDPLSVNEYQYARNAPTRFTDPMGLEPNIPSISTPAEVLAGKSPAAGLKALKDFFTNLAMAMDGAQHAARTGGMQLHDINALNKAMNEYWRAIKAQADLVSKLPKELRDVRPPPPAPPPVDPSRKCPTGRVQRPGQPNATPPRGTPTPPRGTAQPPSTPQPPATPKPPYRGPSGSSFNPSANAPGLGQRIGAGIRDGLNWLGRGARRILPWVGPAVVTYQVANASPENRPHVAATGVGGVLGGLGGGALVAGLITGPIGWGAGLLILGGGLIGGYAGSSIGGAAVPAPRPPGQ